MVREGFRRMVLYDAVHDVLGPAINSAKSLFLYGAPGNGKTMIAETISQMLGGDMFVPLRVEVEGQMMILYDPVYHHAVSGRVRWRRTRCGRRLARVAPATTDAT